MSARVFILRRQGGEDGPYSEEEVLDALEAGDLSPRDWARIEDQPQAQMLGEIFEHLQPSGEAPTKDLVDPDPPADPEESADGDPLPLHTGRRLLLRGADAARVAREVDALGDEDGGEDWEQDDDEGDDEDDDDDEDEDEDEGEEDEDMEEEIVYRGSPSVFGYGWPLAVSGGVLAAGYWLGQFGVKWVVGALVVALLLIVRLLLHRGAREYVVTTERVAATMGWVAKTTRHIELRELGSIRLHRPWPLGWLGVGTIIFSREGGGDGDVLFERVGRVQRVIALVRDCQRRQAGR